MNIQDLKSAHQVQERIRALADQICIVHPEHEGYSDYPYIKFELDDEDTPTEIILYITTQDMVNESCSCHPEYRLKTVSSTHEIPVSEILEDHYLTEWGGIDETHPYIKRYTEQLKGEEEKKKKEKEQKLAAEEAGKKRQAEEAERQQLARLKAKYPDQR